MSRHSQRTAHQGLGGLPLRVSDSSPHTQKTSGIGTRRDMNISVNNEKDSYSRPRTGSFDAIRGRGSSEQSIYHHAVLVQHKRRTVRYPLLRWQYVRYNREWGCVNKRSNYRGRSSRSNDHRSVSGSGKCGVYPIQYCASNAYTIRCGCSNKCTRSSRLRESRIGNGNGSGRFRSRNNRHLGRELHLNRACDLGASRRHGALQLRKSVSEHQFGVGHCEKTNLRIEQLSTELARSIRSSLHGSIPGYSSERYAGTGGCDR